MGILHAPASDRTLERRFQTARSLQQFIAGAKQQQSLWVALYRRVRLEDGWLERVRALPARRHLLVLLEDWCGDAINTVPILARLAEAVPEKLELRVLERDRNPDLMETHLSDGARSIPVVMVLDENFRELGWWGPRPRVLQRWYAQVGKQIAQHERYKQLRTWYARDRGRTTVDEVLAIAVNDTLTDAA